MSLGLTYKDMTSQFGFRTTPELGMGSFLNSYYFDLIPPDSYELDVRYEGFVMGEPLWFLMGHIPVVVGDDELVVQDYQVPSMQTIRGCVVNEDRSAATGLSASLAMWFMDDMPLYYGAEGDSNGCYMFEDMFSGEYTLEIYAGDTCMLSYDIVMSGEDLELETVTCN